MSACKIYADRELHSTWKLHISINSELIFLLIRTSLFAWERGGLMNSSRGFRIPDFEASGGPRLGDSLPWSFIMAGVLSHRRVAPVHRASFFIRRTVIDATR